MGDKKSVGNSLLAVSSAAVLAVYAAGYVRTRAAAERFAEQTEARVRPLIEAPRVVLPPEPAKPDAPAAAFPPVLKRTPEKKLRKRSTVTAPAPALQATTDLPAAAAAAAPPPVAPDASAVPAVAAPDQPPALQTPPAPRWKDGTYFGWGTSRHGDIQAQVVIEGGRIASATIAQCLTRYSCSVIGKLPPQVAERQSPETDYVSGATQSTNAFYYAVVEALSKAK